jgi:hypothetical protein
MTDGRSHSTKHESNQHHSSTALRVICETAGQRRMLTRQEHDLYHISYEPVTKCRTLEHRGSRTLRLCCIPHTTERTGFITTSLKNIWTLRQYPATCNDHAFARIVYYDLSDLIRNYISSSAKTMSLNDLTIRNNNMLTREKLRQTASKQFHELYRLQSRLETTRFLDNAR